MAKGPGGRREVWRRRAEKAGVYDRGVGEWVTAREANLILDFLGGTKGPVLDFPCGSGRLTRAVTQAGHQVMAADLLWDMAAFTRNLAGPRVVQADIFRPPFRPASFQAVLAVRIFFHYPDHRALLAALAGLVAPGGRLIFDTLNPVSLRRAAAPLADLIRRDPRRRLVFSSPRRIPALAEELGLRLVGRKSLHLFPTRFYGRLPVRWVKLLDKCEAYVPAGWRVLTFWALERPAGREADR